MAVTRDRPFRNADRGPGYSYRPDDRPPSIFGAHQPGIATPQLDHAVLAAYDLPEPRALREVLEAWSAQAEELMRAHPRELTLTIGLGAGAFAAGNSSNNRPLALHPLPAFAGDELDPAFCGGDVLVIAAGDNAGLAATSARLGERAPRWTQRGFLRRDPRDPPKGRPRDPLGFRDGTHNLRRPRDLDRHVWVERGDRSWMQGGTCLVVRRIRIDTHRWNRLQTDDQERVVGRHKQSGAPLGRSREFDPMVMTPPDAPNPSPAANAHVRLAAPETNEGAAMLRRSYSYHDDATQETGLLFLAFQRDPRRQFVPVQQRLAQHDALSDFVTHTGSALFAIPPGARPQGFVGDRLFGP